MGCAQRADKVVFAAGGRSEDFDVGTACQLQQCGTHATGGAVHEQTVARAGAGDAVQHLPGRDVGKDNAHDQ